MRMLLCLMALMLVGFGCETADSDLDARDGDAQRIAAKKGDVGEVEIPLGQVPEHVKRAAEKAVPGIKLTSAEREVEGGVTVYDLEGTANGVEYEVEVTADGKVLEVEEEDDDDDDDDDEDHDDDDD